MCIVQIEKRTDWIVPLLTLPNISNIMHAMERRQRDKYHIEYYNTYVKLCFRVFLYAQICARTVKQNPFDLFVTVIPKYWIQFTLFQHYVSAVPKVMYINTKKIKLAI